MVLWNYWWGEAGRMIEIRGQEYFKDSCSKYWMVRTLVKNCISILFCLFFGIDRQFVARELFW